MLIGVLGEIDFCLYYADFLALLFSSLFILQFGYDIEYSRCSINICTPVLLPYEALFENFSISVWFIVCVEGRISKSDVCLDTSSPAILANIHIHLMTKG
jgi:hypothetical protein